eukprot:4443259-Prymnesium_polylepis.2
MNQHHEGITALRGRLRAHVPRARRATRWWASGGPQTRRAPHVRRADARVTTAAEGTSRQRRTHLST